MRKHPEDLKDAMRFYHMNEYRAIDFVLYKNTPGHRDKYYYATPNFYDEGGPIICINLKTGTMTSGLKSAPVEYYYDKVIEKDGKLYGIMFEYKDDPETGDTVLLKSREVMFTDW